MKVSINVTRDKKNGEKLMSTGVQVVAVWVTGRFETQIFCLWHEGSTTWIQCQLGFVGDPCCYQKTPFEKFCD